MNSAQARSIKKKAPARRSTSFEPLAAQAFGETVRALREGQGLAQDHFALKASVDRSYYGKLERGERQPTLGLLLRIADGLGVPGAALVEMTEATICRLRRAAAKNGDAERSSRLKAGQ